MAGSNTINSKAGDHPLMMRQVLVTAFFSYVSKQMALTSDMAFFFLLIRDPVLTGKTTK